MTKQQHVLIIGKVWIEPSSSAAGSRTLQLIDVFLKQGCTVSFATTAAHSDFKANLSALGIKEYNIELNNSSFDVFIKSLKPTLVLFDRFTTEEQFGWRVAEHCADALRVLDTIDLHCLRAARHQAFKENREFSSKDLFNDTAKRELASIYRCDLSLMISTIEMDLLHQYFKVNPHLLHYIPFLAEPLTPATQARWPSFREREHFITIGNFLHAPNWDSTLYLKQTIWPLIRKQLPTAELHIYGAYPSQKVFQLHNQTEGFLIKGRAHSVEDVMKKAKICLAPIRFGAGIKGKLMDAMLYGTPSITSPIGAESMHGDLPWNGAIESNPEKFVEAAVKIYTDEITWQQTQQNGQQIINTFFSKAKHTLPFLSAISFIQTNLKAHRLNNFTGAMLMHHSLSASKYMALWIEAKNK